MENYHNTEFLVVFFFISRKSHQFDLVFLHNNLFIVSFIFSLFLSFSTQFLCHFACGFQLEVNALCLFIFFFFFFFFFFFSAGCLTPNNPTIQSCAQCILYEDASGACVYNEVTRRCDYAEKYEGKQFIPPYLVSKKNSEKQ